MGELASYRLSDFILFSQTAYYRQFELYNQAIWPLHLVAILISLLIGYALLKKPDWAGRVISGLLVVSWCWVAWAFLYQRFYQIHVVADGYALGFVLQAGFITWYGVIKNRLTRIATSQPRMIIGAGVLFIALVFYPVEPLRDELSIRVFIEFIPHGIFQFYQTRVWMRVGLEKKGNTAVVGANVADFL